MVAGIHIVVHVETEGAPGNRPGGLQGVNQWLGASAVGHVAQSDGPVRREVRGESSGGVRIDELGEGNDARDVEAVLHEVACHSEAIFVLNRRIP